MTMQDKITVVGKHAEVFRGQHAYNLFSNDSVGKEKLFVPHFLKVFQNKKSKRKLCLKLFISR